MGESSKLDDVPIKNGNILYTTDNNKLYIDTNKRNLITQSYGLATTESAGLMSAEDKALLMQLKEQVDQVSKVQTKSTVDLSYTVTVSSLNAQMTTSLNSYTIPSNFNFTNGYFYYSNGGNEYTFIDNSSTTFYTGHPTLTLYHSYKQLSNLHKVYGYNYGCMVYLTAKLDSGQLTFELTYTSIENTSVTYTASSASQGQSMVDSFPYTSTYNVPVTLVYYV